MLTATANIIHRTDEIYVEVTWSGAPLDRPSTGGFGLKKSHLALANRLKRAIDAQAVHTDPEVKADTYGKTYVSARCRVLGRMLNADLKRLGF